MNQKIQRFVLSVVGVIVSVIALQEIALAGPPLLCWPFDIGNAKSLPWGGSAWREARADYDVRHLADDTVALLTPDTPVLVRMETLRRATVYAMKDPQVASALYSRLSARVSESKQDEALLLFDLGYLVEALKQATLMGSRSNLTGHHDGYALVLKAIQKRGGDPGMEFAAALMTLLPKRNSQPEHLQKALAGAPDGSLLARNLVSHFRDRGNTLAELQASVGKEKE